MASLVAPTRLSVRLSASAVTRRATPVARVAGLCGSSLRLSSASSAFNNAIKLPAARRPVVAARASPAPVAAAGGFSLKSITEKAPWLETAFYIALWYLFNVKFNILNKQMYNYFPFPWFVSCVHLAVGVLVASAFWIVKLVPFEKPSSSLLKVMLPAAAAHASGHCLTNLSFAATAVSFTHIVKTLEPIFSALGSYLVSGAVYGLPVYLSMIPIMFGVMLASATELSFSWLGFGSAMFSNAAFAARAIWSKGFMSKLSAVNTYNYVSIVALLFCIPPTLLFEGATIQAGMAAAFAKVGWQEHVSNLLQVGLFYHLYNQVAFQALDKVEPITHAIANVGKRVFVIGFSILAFGNVITTQAAVGSLIAIAGAGLYSIMKAQDQERQKKLAAK